MKTKPTPRTAEFHPNGSVFTAVRRGDAEALMLALRRGGQVNASDDLGDSLLHLACRNGSLEIARLLLERGADTERRNSEDKTPIGNAASKGDVEMIRLLARYGADVTADQGSGRLPIDLAALAGHSEAVRFLKTIPGAGVPGRLAICRFIRAIRALVGCVGAKNFYFVAGA